MTLADQLGQLDRSSRGIIFFLSVSIFIDVELAAEPTEPGRAMDVDTPKETDVVEENICR